MNTELINSIVSCAFKICLTYILKYFDLLSFLKLYDYDKELCCQINKLRDILGNKCDTIHNNAYDLIKEKIKDDITEKIKDKYGDDVSIDFSYDVQIQPDKHNDENDEKQKVLYSLRVKEMNNKEPDESKFNKSEIYVNTKKKTFCVKTDKGFKEFPLIKKSIIRCEKKDQNKI